MVSPKTRRAQTDTDALIRFGLDFPDYAIARYARRQKQSLSLRRNLARRSAYHLWTPPSRQGKTLGSLLRVVGCCHLSGL